MSSNQPFCYCDPSSYAAPSDSTKCEPQGCQAIAAIFMCIYLGASYLSFLQILKHKFGPAFISYILLFIGSLLLGIRQLLKKLIESNGIRLSKLAYKRMDKLGKLALFAVASSSYLAIIMVACTLFLPTNDQNGIAWLILNRSAFGIFIYCLLFFKLPSTQKMVNSPAGSPSVSSTSASSDQTPKSPRLIPGGYGIKEFELEPPESKHNSSSLEISISENYYSSNNSCISSDTKPESNSTDSEV
ncbi:hypothetical protein PPL_03375 [Heterostelium album PN500]|uniref:Uncharacterized protein n=1 Tax=Heterostelium pallidum (strain ATCC 26659 / Pp 5 / PN500) TaxID=670386 RepID=D3B4Q0_HETP5|nr:hypothetical protein PPL_03375 [Heterostelium album PN500]EFA84298.1 hypothetical protein PPL_03375 [Heterostelium album PN500]|eukprot:XP_020436414.1 hypothetical protein PPL_03375 [Heterostelium album PN500]